MAVRAAWHTALTAGAVVGCLGCGDDPTPERPPAAGPAAVVSVARPVSPEPVKFPRPGAIELRARGVHQRGGAAWFAVVVSPPANRARDACLGIGLQQSDLYEADDVCDVMLPDGVVSFVEKSGIPDRYGPAPTIVSGVAAPAVSEVRIEGPGGTRRLPLSRHRAFMAVYAWDARGRVRLVAERRGAGPVVRTFRLPLSARDERTPSHQHRRRGAVFNDEVGEAIVGSSYAQVVERFGPPAVIRRERARRCAYYEVVGSPHDGWRFCFGASGRMVDANGGKPPPHS
jgi:hypothetical protein